MQSDDEGDEGDEGGEEEAVPDATMEQASGGARPVVGTAEKRRCLDSAQVLNEVVEREIAQLCKEEALRFQALFSQQGERADDVEMGADSPCVVFLHILRVEVFVLALIRPSAGPTASGECAHAKKYTLPPRVTVCRQEEWRSGTMARSRTRNAVHHQLEFPVDHVLLHQTQLNPGSAPQLSPQELHERSLATNVNNLPMDLRRGHHDISRSRHVVLVQTLDETHPSVRGAILHALLW